jgi:hypothetical protein
MNKHIKEKKGFDNYAQTAKIVNTALQNNF